MRIFDSNAELIDALAVETVDIGYNVPMTQAQAAIDAGADIEVVVPDDYAVSPPWTAFVPAASANTGAVKDVLDYILSDTGQERLARSYMAVTDVETAEVSLQFVALNPGLLVYLDPLKKSRLLNTWFQLVTNS